jgi:hypothetical protein
MTDNLAPVYLDNKPINLKDPKPKVSAVLSAGGKPETTDVKWLQFQPNTQGKSLRSEEVLDRTTDPTKPIYLTSGHGGSASGGKEAMPSFKADIAPPFGETPKVVRPGGAKPAPKADDSGMQGEDDMIKGGEPTDE